MLSLDRLVWAAGVAISSYGLRVGLRANNDAALARMLALLPSGWEPATNPVVDRLYSLIIPAAPTRPGMRQFHLVYGDAQRLARALQPEEVLAALEQDLHAFLAEFARDRTFVHAGVVGWQGQALLLPGRTFAGKSTLVSALLRAGAVYYSDEYAVLDTDGRVYPFPRLLSLRDAGGAPTRRMPSAVFGAETGVQPLPVGLVLITTYLAGARFRPRAISPGKAVLELLANTVAARSAPENAFRVLRRVAVDAVVLKGARGEADAVATRLLRLMATARQSA